MRTAYKYVAHIIAAFVVVQAGVVVWSMFVAIGSIIEGTTLDGPPVGAILHGNIGMFVIPVLALALLVIAILAHAGLKWALWLLAAVALQIGFAFAAFGAAWVGGLHGINAFAVLILAEVAANAIAHAPVTVPQSQAAVRPAM